MADVSNLLTQGLEHYLNGRLREAATIWEEAIRLDPSNRRAKEYLKSALASHGPRAPGPIAETPESGAEGSGSTAWDDGPSAHASYSLDEHTPSASGASDLIDDDSHLDDAARLQIDNLMRGCRELYALNDFSGALELLEKVHTLDPNRADAERMREDCIETLTHMYESRIGPLDGMPTLVVKPDEIIWLNLDHRAGFVLSQIDGNSSYDDIYSICGMSRLDTSKILSQLIQEKVIRTAR